jgi:hypothetical protein
MTARKRDRWLPINRKLIDRQREQREQPRSRFAIGRQAARALKTRGVTHKHSAFRDLLLTATNSLEDEQRQALRLQQYADEIRDAVLAMRAGRQVRDGTRSRLRHVARLLDGEARGLHRGSALLIAFASLVKERAKKSTTTASKRDEHRRIRKETLAVYSEDPSMGKRRAASTSKTRHRFTQSAEQVRKITWPPRRTK